jgi:hypothetical protein
VLATALHHTATPAVASAPAARIVVLKRQGVLPVVQIAATGLRAGASYRAVATAAARPGCAPVVARSGTSTSSGTLALTLGPVRWCRDVPYGLTMAGFSWRFTVPPDVAVHGTVVDGAGRPVGDARLVLRSAGGRTVATIRTSRTGTFALTVWPGRYRLQGLAVRDLSPPAASALVLRAGHPLRVRVRYHT